MRKPIIVLSLLFAFALVFGCISQDSKTTPTQKPPISNAKIDDLIPKDRLPSGITYLGTNYDATITIGSRSVASTEGVYSSGEVQLIIDVVKSESKKEAETLVKEYKDQEEFKRLGYDPFEEIMVNGHKATQIKTYSLEKGRTTTHYSLIWNNENFMILISIAYGHAENNQIVLLLAQAQGY